MSFRAETAKTLPPFRQGFENAPPAGRLGDSVVRTEFRDPLTSTKCSRHSVIAHGKLLFDLRESPPFRLRQHFFHYHRRYERTHVGNCVSTGLAVQVIGLSSGRLYSLSC